MRKGFFKKHLPEVLAVATLFMTLNFYLFIPFGETDNPFMAVDRFLYHEVLLPNMQVALTAKAPVTILEIDDGDLQEYGSWPWSRDLLAQGFEALEKYNPAVVGCSLLIDPDRHSPQADQRFFNAMQKTNSLVAGFRFDFTSRYVSSSERVGWISKGAVEPSQVSSDNGMPAVFPYKRPMAFNPTALPVANASKALGFIDFDNPRGLLVYPTLANFDGVYYKSYPFALAETYLEKINRQRTNVLIGSDGVKFVSLGDDAVKTLPNGTVLLRPYKKNREWDDEPFPHVRYSDLVHGRVRPEQLNNRIVIFDLTATGYSQSFNFMQDSIATRSMIQATAVSNLLEQRYIRRDLRANAVELILLFCLSVIIWASCRRHSTLEALGFNLLVLPLGVWVLSYIGLDRLNLWILQSYSLTTIVLGFTVQFGYRYFFEDRQRRMVERALRGYTSKAVIEQLIEQGETFLNRAAERRDLSILIFDIKGFTQIAHRLTPEETFQLLNRIFGITDEIITDRHFGIIDKKMGDACIAIFGLNGDTNHPLHAVKAALEIQQVLFERFAELTKLAHKEGFGPGLVQVRIGVSSGSVCLGNVGSDKHYNFTAVGEVVNLCQRLESACAPGSVLVSEETYKRCQDEIDAQEQHAKGKHEEEFYLAYRVKGLKSKNVQ